MSTFKKLVQKQQLQKKEKATHFNLEAQIIADRNRVVACPCNPSKKYKECCEPIHQNISLATTPEQLMRSRYSAFVLAKIDYLQKSHHSSTRPSLNEAFETEKWTKSVRWIKLEVLNANDDTVTFKAYFIENGQQQIIQEKSKFVKENNYWTYLNGIHF